MHRIRAVDKGVGAAARHETIFCRYVLNAHCANIPDYKKALVARAECHFKLFNYRSVDCSIFGSIVFGCSDVCSEAKTDYDTLIEQYGEEDEDDSDAEVEEEEVSEFTIGQKPRVLTDYSAQVGEWRSKIMEIARVRRKVSYMLPCNICSLALSVLLNLRATMTG